MIHFPPEIRHWYGHSFWFVPYRDGVLSDIWYLAISQPVLMNVRNIVMRIRVWLIFDELISGLKYTLKSWHIIKDWNKMMNQNKTY